GPDSDGAGPGVEREGNVGVVEGEGVAQRDEVAGALGGLDAGEAGDFEEVALGDCVGGGRPGEGGGKSGGRLGGSAAVGDGLLADVDHAGAVVGADVGERAVGSGHEGSVVDGQSGTAEKRNNKRPRNDGNRNCECGRVVAGATPFPLPLGGGVTRRR